MKGLYFISILFLGIVLIGCSNDDDNTIITTSGIDGIWNLTNISGGFGGINEEYPNGVIIWNFNSSNKEITITNTADENAYTVLPTGVYKYSIVKVGDVKELVVGDNNLGTFTISGNTFIIDEQPRDGFIITFLR